MNTDGTERWRLRLWLTWPVVVLVGLGLTSDALAQSGDRSDQAKAKFLAGQAAAERGDLQSARVSFLASLEIFPAPGTLLNLADCEEELGLVASAKRHFQEAVPLLRAGDDRIAFANKRVRALEHRIPKLRIELIASAAMGTRVLLDARELPAASLGRDMPVDPGSHVVTVAAPERVDRTYAVKLVEKQLQVVSVEPGGPKPTAAAAAAPIRTPATNSSSTMQNVAIAIGGVGILGTGIGAITGGIALQKKADLEKLCPIPAQCTVEGQRMAQEGKALGITSTVGLAVGIPLAVAGVALVFVSRRGASSVQIIPASGGGSMIMAETPF